MCVVKLFMAVHNNTIANLKKILAKMNNKKSTKE